MFEPGNKRIHYDSYAIRKNKIKMKERWVVLNPVGVRVIEAYLDLDKELPEYSGWRKNLKRWSRAAGIKVGGESPKSTRKTWECWLFKFYPMYANHIFLSQGHNNMVALKHYVQIPFNDEDKNQMKEFVYGWEP